MYIAQWTQTPPTTTAPPTTTPTTTAPPATTVPPTTPSVVPPETEGMWALVNLVLSITGVVIAIVVTVRALLLKKKDDTPKDKTSAQKNVNTNAANKHENDNTEKFTQHKTLGLITTIALAIIGVIVFLITEDTNLPMHMVDKWNIINLIILIIELITITFTFKHKKTNNKIKNEQNQANNPLTLKQ
jgi:uncharacterized membrane protein